MTANSEIIQSSSTHPGGGADTMVTGEKFKGDGYYGRSDGFHTVQYTFSGISGTIKIQATLAVTPVEADWFDVHSYNTSTQETGSKMVNFTGNYVWIRSKVSYTEGTISSITLNH